jgi:hypothetical protein
MAKDIVYIKAVVEEHKAIMAEAVNIANYTFKRANEMYSNMLSQKMANMPMFGRLFMGYHDLTLNDNDGKIEFKLSHSSGGIHMIKLDFKYILDKTGIDDEIESFCIRVLDQVEKMQQFGGLQLQSINGWPSTTTDYIPLIYSGTTTSATMTSIENILSSGGLHTIGTGINSTHTTQYAMAQSTQYAMAQ